MFVKLNDICSIGRIELPFEPPVWNDEITMSPNVTFVYVNGLPSPPVLRQLRIACGMWLPFAQARNNCGDALPFWTTKWKSCKLTFPTPKPVPCTLEPELLAPN